MGLGILTVKVLTGLTEISEVQPDSTDEFGNPIHGYGRLFTGESMWRIL